jgi:hypothetical protein
MKFVVSLSLSDMLLAFGTISHLLHKIVFPIPGIFQLPEVTKDSHSHKN